MRENGRGKMESTAEDAKNAEEIRCKMAEVRWN